MLFSVGVYYQSCMPRSRDWMVFMESPPGILYYSEILIHSSKNLGIWNIALKLLPL